MYRKCTRAHNLQNNACTHSFCSPTVAAVFNGICQLSSRSLNLSPRMFLLSVAFPLVLSYCLRRTARVQASWTSWCLQVSPPSPLNQRSTLFLPRGSALSVHVRTAWLTAIRSDRVRVFFFAQLSLFLIKISPSNILSSFHYRSPQSWCLHHHPQPGNVKKFI